MIKSKAQKYPDGVVQIYRTENIAEPGNMPEEGTVRKATLRYRRRTIGNARYYEAMQNNAKVDIVIRCLYRKEVSVQDIAVILGEEEQYIITRVMDTESSVPREMELTLERIDADYDEVD